MSLLTLARAASLRRGYEYYKNKKVLRFVKSGESTFEGYVAGSGAQPYRVSIDVAHPRSSKCSCPLANGTHIVCKHMIALLFAAFPEEAAQYYEDVVQAEEAEEARQENLQELLVAYVSKMKKAELQQALLDLLLYGPEWQYEAFLQESISEYYE